MLKVQTGHLEISLLNGIYCACEVCNILKFYVFLQGTDGNWAKFSQPGYYGHIHACNGLFI